MYGLPWDKCGVILYRLEIKRQRHVQVGGGGARGLVLAATGQEGSD